jgi:GNAT superfamily N-acetyltransferase
MGQNPREALESDIPRICELAGQLGYELSGGTAHTRWEATRTEDVGLAVAEEGRGQVIGWVEIHVETHLLAGRRARVTGLVVDRGARRGGVGRRLLDWAEQWARSHGCAEAYLTTNVKRQDAHGFYDHLGWTRRKTSHVYAKVV